jgi:ADP-ribosylglycohydrolase
VTRRTLDHYRGCFLGGAVGDALGAPVEFLDLGAIRERFGADGVQSPVPVYGRAGAITDDTQMLLFTAEGLLRARHGAAGAGPEQVASAVWRAYLRWLRTQGERSPVDSPMDGWLIGERELHARRAPGSTCLAALRSGLMGTRRDPINDSKGCGGVMRIAPAGLAGGRAFETGCDLAAITHGHPTGYVAAGLFAHVVHGLGEGLGLPLAVRAAVEMARPEPGAGETVAALEAALEHAGRSEGTPEDVERLGGGWTAEDAVAIAVYCALKAKDFAHGVRLAVNHSGDSDSTGSMAGSLLGLVHGEAAIPRTWLERLELRKVVAELAEDFWWHFGMDPPARCEGEPGCGLRGKYPGS